MRPRKKLEVLENTKLLAEKDGIRGDETGCIDDMVVIPKQRRDEDDG